MVNNTNTRDVGKSIDKIYIKDGTGDEGSCPPELPFCVRKEDKSNYKCDKDEPIDILDVIKKFKLNIKKSGDNSNEESSYLNFNRTFCNPDCKQSDTSVNTTKGMFEQKSNKCNCICHPRIFIFSIIKRKYIDLFNKIRIKINEDNSDYIKREELFEKFFEYQNKNKNQINLDLPKLSELIKTLQEVFSDNEDLKGQLETLLNNPIISVLDSFKDEPNSQNHKNVYNHTNKLSPSLDDTAKKEILTHVSHIIDIFSIINLCQDLFTDSDNSQIHTDTLEIAINSANTLKKKFGIMSPVEAARGIFERKGGSLRIKKYKKRSYKKKSKKLKNKKYIKNKCSRKKNKHFGGSKQTRGKINVEGSYGFFKMLFDFIGFIFKILGGG